MPDPKPGAISELAKCLRELRRTRAELTKAWENLEEAKERRLDAERGVAAWERMLLQATRDRELNE